MRVRARRKKNTQPASIAFVFQASRVSTRIALSEASFPPHEHRHFIIIIGTTSSQLHCHDVESHDVAIWIQARACLVVVRPPMNKRKALGATSSGAAQLAAPCAKQSRASSSSAFSACCTGNQGEPPQAVALSAVPQGSTVAALEGTKGPPQTALLMITQQQMEDTSQLDRLPLDWLQWLDRKSVWSLFVCGRTTALSAGFLAFTGRMYLQH